MPNIPVSPITHLCAPAVPLPSAVTHSHRVYFFLGSADLCVFRLQVPEPLADFRLPACDIAGQATEETVHKRLRLRLWDMRVCEDGVGLVRPRRDVAVVALGKIARAGMRVNMTSMTDVVLYEPTDPVEVIVAAHLNPVDCRSHRSGKVGVLLPDGLDCCNIRNLRAALAR